MFVARLTIRKGWTSGGSKDLEIRSKVTADLPTQPQVGELVELAMRAYAVRDDAEAS